MQKCPRDGAPRSWARCERMKEPLLPEFACKIVVVRAVFFLNDLEVRPRAALELAGLRAPAAEHIDKHRILIGVAAARQCLVAAGDFRGVKLAAFLQVN